MSRLEDARTTMACYYEAGRAMARWWGGVGLRAVTMPGHTVVPLPSELAAARSEPDPLDLFLKGRTWDIPASTDSLRDRAWREWGRMEVVLVTCYAGSVAWARHRKRNVASCLAEDGRDDAERARVISETHFTRPNPVGSSAASCRETALTYAKKLVRSSPGWEAVSSLAAVLDDYGRLECEEIDTRCHAAFYARPLPPGWDPHWPPEPGILEQGFMPQAHWPWYWDDARRYRDADQVSLSSDPCLAHMAAG